MTSSVRTEPRRLSTAQGGVTALVVDRLEDLIFNGQLDAGDPLPSEAELASELGVSRLTVREAVRTMQARGLLEVSHGRRPTVAPPNAVPLHDFFSAAVRRDAGGLFELLEVRLAVEVQTAQMAARNATRADLAGMAAALEDMRRSQDDEAAFNTADMRFHAAVARASGNRTLSLLVEGMEGPLYTSRLESIRGYKARSEDLSELLSRHEDIFKRIEERDARGAAASMRKHLKGTRNDLRAAFSLRSGYVQ